MNSSDPSSQSLYQVVESGFNSSTILYLFLVLVLLFLAALMSGSESAFFSLKPSDSESLKKENTPKSIDDFVSVHINTSMVDNLTAKLIITA
jgi:CBS domain containing-hemolysin-like protein